MMQVTLLSNRRAAISSALLLHATSHGSLDHIQVQAYDALMQNIWTSELDSRHFSRSSNGSLPVGCSSIFRLVAAKER